MNPMNALDHFTLCLRGTQHVVCVDSPDHQHIITIELDLSRDLANEIPLTGINLTSLQRTAEGSSQSATRGRNDIVQRSCVRWKIPGGKLIVFSDLRMNTKHHRLLLGG
jgi:hypothetical protein